MLGLGVDKKKALCSSKHSIKEHDDEITNANNQEIPTNNDIHLEEVFPEKKCVDKFRLTATLFSRFIPSMTGNMQISEMNNVNKNFFV